MIDTWSENFCKSVKKLREENNLTKAEMAKKLKISVKTLTMIERGIVPPRLSCGIVIYIYKEFGVCADELIE
ncbi:MAG: helix-turn-helix transcriptional regulator [Clostridia bacterium]|nr:helix-turn-helix transcriptional regulator [Clostridia bacterium]